MIHYVPKIIQLLLIKQFNCDMKHSPIKISADTPVNDKEYTLFSHHVAKVTETKPAHINTWKRVFEKYINSKTGEPYQPSPTTYQTIAKFLGYKSWEELEALKDSLKPHSRRSVTEIVFSPAPTPMSSGDIMEIHYEPDRILRMEYRGDYFFNYKVVQTINTRFEYGDLVHVPPFKVGEPINGWDIMRNNKKIGQYYSAENHLINFKRVTRRTKNN